MVRPKRARSWKRRIQPRPNLSHRASARLYVCRETAEMQLVRVQPEELSIHLGSYLRGGEGDRSVEAAGTDGPRGGSASVRAATRVKPEQAPKILTLEPSRHPGGKGRRSWSEQSTDEDQLSNRGNGRSTYASIEARHGRPAAVRTDPQRLLGGRPTQESEGLIVPLKPGNAGGGKEPWFRVRRDEPRVGRSA